MNLAGAERQRVSESLEAAQVRLVLLDNKKNDFRRPTLTMREWLNNMRLIKKCVKLNVSLSKIGLQCSLILLCVIILIAFFCN